MLTKDELKVARIIKENKYVDIITKETGLTYDELLFYFYDDYKVCLEAELDKNEKEYFKLPHKVLLALEVFDREMIRWFIPMIISVLSIIMSIVALILSVT